MPFIQKQAYTLRRLYEKDTAVHAEKTGQNLQNTISYPAAAANKKAPEERRQRGIRRREFERFISELEKLPEAVSEFDETLLLQFSRVFSHTS